MLDLNNGILKIDDIEFSYDITITDFIKKFGNRLKNKPTFLFDKSKPLHMYIEDIIFLDIKCEHITIWFDNEKIKSIDIYPKTNVEFGKDEEKYEFCKKISIEKLGIPTIVIGDESSENRETIFKYKYFDIELSTSYDYIGGWYDFNMCVEVKK